MVTGRFYGHHFCGHVKPCDPFLGWQRSFKKHRSFWDSKNEQKPSSNQHISIIFQHISMGERSKSLISFPDISGFIHKIDQHSSFWILINHQPQERSHRNFHQISSGFSPQATASEAVPGERCGCLRDMRNR